MKKYVNALIAVAVVVCLSPIAAMALDNYSQDFEGLTQTDTGALAADGWVVYGNVFGPDWGWWYGYGVYAAPNDGFGFCQIVTGEGIGAQALVSFSDYNNADHGNGAFIESNVFQERTIGAGDVGTTWVFGFQAKMGNLTGGSTALAFIKTLDPNAGWATTNFITLDMTSTPASWSQYTIDLEIIPALAGQIVQFGFSNTATNYESSGVFYDEVTFSLNGEVATVESNWGAVKSLYR